MSRSIQDLVDAIRQDEDHRFDLDAVVRTAVWRSRRRTVRRRTATAVTVAALAVLVAVAVPSAVLRRAGGEGQPATTGSVTGVRPSLSFTLHDSAEGDWTVTPASVGEHLQIGYVRRVGEIGTSGSVEVYEPGGFDPTTVRGEKPTTVEGVPGYYAVVPNPFNAAMPAGSSVDVPTLAWRYGPDAWVVVRGDISGAPPPTGQVPDSLRQVAAAVEIGAPVPVRLPFGVGYRPVGLRPVNVLTYDAVDVRRTVEYDRVGGNYNWRDPYAYVQAPLRIAMTPAVPGQWLPDTTVGGRPAMRNGDHEIIVARDGQWVSIGSGTGTPALTQAEVEQIYAGLSFADWSDQSTWFEAATSA